METQTSKMNDKGKQNWLWWLIGFLILNFIITEITKGICKLKPEAKEILSCSIPGISISLTLFGIFLLIFAILLIKHNGFKFFNYTYNTTKQKARSWSIFYMILGIILIISGIIILI